MTVTTTVHVNFRGQAREALSFYQSVFGGDLALATYTDIHSVESPELAGHIAFGRVKAASGFDIMAYDVHPPRATIAARTPSTSPSRAPAPTRSGHSGTAWPTTPPLSSPHWPPAPFAPLYGMLTDRFGVTWIVGVQAPQG